MIMVLVEVMMLVVLRCIDMFYLGTMISQG
jgi:hypothetical protein